MYVFDTANKNFDICKQVPTVNEIKQTVQNALQKYFAKIDVKVPELVLSASAAFITLIILTMAIPVLV